MDKKLILVVDDEPSILIAVKDTLEINYDVITAKNGKEAIKMIEKHNPDLVIMDIMMPDMDGFEAIKKIREQGKLLKTPVIFLSAKTGIADIEHGLELGGFDYITKPFSPSKLLKKVDEAFQRLEIRKKIQQKKISEK
ncbi:MAG: response regulator [Candidatus Goldbacteria bacterium]|nr:response regulator [Candidatus Goldiibacteriota bacterium]